MHSHEQVDCTKAMAQLWEYLDRELNADGIAAVQKHLAECKACHPHADFAERFLAALGRCRCTDPMPAGLRARVEEALHRQQNAT